MFAFITGSGRCGTTLMRSLLDGHPDLHVYPTEVSHFLELFLRDSGLAAEAPFTTLSAGMLRQFAVTYPGSEDFPAIDWDRIASESGDRPFTPNSLLRTVFRQAFPEDGGMDVCDVTTPHISGYLSHFPNAKVVHMIRHPAATLNSVYRFYFMDPNAFACSPGDWPLGPAFERIRESFRQAERHREHPNVIVVRLEDLQKDPVAEMSRVCAFLGIRFADSCGTPTMAEKVFQGNSTHQQNFGVFKQDADVSCLTDNDLYYVSTLKAARPFYDIPERPWTRNAFPPFLARHFGWKGRGRPRLVRSPFRFFVKLPLFTIAAWFRDLAAKADYDVERGMIASTPNRGKVARDNNTTHAQAGEADG